MLIYRYLDKLIGICNYQLKNICQRESYRIDPAYNVLQTPRQTNYGGR